MSQTTETPTSPAVGDADQASLVLFEKVSMPAFALGLQSRGVPAPQDAAEFHRLVESADVLEKVAAAVRGAVRASTHDPVKAASDLLLGTPKAVDATAAAARAKAASSALVDPAVRDAALALFATTGGK